MTEELSCLHSELAYVGEQKAEYDVNRYFRCKNCGSVIVVPPSGQKSTSSLVYLIDQQFDPISLKVSEERGSASDRLTLRLRSFFLNETYWTMFPLWIIVFT